MTSARVFPEQNYIMNNEWITDRRPTAEDSDEIGDVWTWDCGGRRKSHYASGNGKNKEVPWYPRLSIQTDPAPYVNPETEEQAMDRREKEARACVPDGFVVGGRGPLEIRKGLPYCYCAVFSLENNDDRWNEGEFSPTSDFVLYAFPRDSEIAKLNHLGQWDKTKVGPFPDDMDLVEDLGRGH